MSRLNEARALIDYTDVTNIPEKTLKIFNSIKSYCNRGFNVSKAQLDVLQSIYRQSVGGGQYEKRGKV